MLSDLNEHFGQYIYNLNFRCLKVSFKIDNTTKATKPYFPLQF